MEWMHDRNVIHRDLKPQNFLISCFPNSREGHGKRSDVKHCDDSSPNHYQLDYHCDERPENQWLYAEFAFVLVTFTSSCCWLLAKCNVNLAIFVYHGKPFSSHLIICKHECAATG